MNDAATAMGHALSGIKVLDLSQYIPGPFASLMLADFGAEVVKIEPPNGDEMQALGPRDAAGEPVFYQALNASKSVLRLDLKSEQGQACLREHLADADVFIEGFRPGVMVRLGLDYPTLAAIRPELIYCSISGHGAAGPMASVAGHDANYLATGGMLDRNGRDRPDYFDPPIADMAGALFATIAILAALQGRHQTGRGVHIDLGLADAVMPLQMLHVAEWAANGTIPKPQSSYLNGGAAYYQVYATRDDRHLVLGAVEPKFWQRFCQAAGRHDWLDRHNEPIPQHDLIAELQTFFGGLSCAEALARFEATDCCVSPVLDLGAALNEPQCVGRGLVSRANGDAQTLFPALFDGQSLLRRRPLVPL